MNPLAIAIPLSVIFLVLLMMTLDGLSLHDDWRHNFRWMTERAKPLGTLSHVDTSDLFEMAEKFKKQQGDSLRLITNEIMNGSSATRQKKKLETSQRAFAQIKRELKKRGAESP